LLAQFQTFDTNGDGVLTKEEIYQGYIKLYGEVVTESEVVNSIFISKQIYLN